jgi:hypothetical protein
MNTEALPAPTQEEIAQAIKLEGIFSPQTRERRDAKFRRDNPDGTDPAHARINFAHYTSADGAIEILKSKRLWMRNTTCMIDFREVEHGYGFLLEYFRDSAKHQQFLAAMNAVSQNAGNDAIGFFDRLWGHIRTDTYITCLSEHDAKSENEIGRLSMWRGFGSDQPRVALVFSVPWFANLAANVGIIVSPCAYLKPSDAPQILDQVVANVTQNQAYLQTLPPVTLRGWIFQALLLMATCTKHHGFEEEREWRGVHTPAISIPTLVTPSKTIYRGVPQTIFEMPFDSTVSPRLAQLDMSMLLDRVIIGPTQYGSAMRRAFVDALSVAGVSQADARVFNSDIPIRT